MNKLLTATILTITILSIGFMVIPNNIAIADSKKTVNCDNGCTLNFKGKSSVDIIIPKSGGGEKGEKGDKGDQGDVGPAGQQGEVGPAGPQGDKGDQGETGAQGDKGETGDQGPKGDQGEKGDTGPAGAGNGTELTDNQTQAIDFVIQNQDTLKALVDAYDNGSLFFVEANQTQPEPPIDNGTIPQPPVDNGTNTNNTNGTG